MCDLIGIPQQPISTIFCITIKNARIKVKDEKKEKVPIAERVTANNRLLGSSIANRRGGLTPKTDMTWWTQYIYTHRFIITDHYIDERYISLFPRTFTKTIERQEIFPLKKDTVGGNLIDHVDIYIVVVGLVEAGGWDEWLIECVGGWWLDEWLMDWRSVWNYSLHRCEFRLLFEYTQIYRFMRVVRRRWECVMLMIIWSVIREIRREREG